MEVSWGDRWLPMPIHKQFWSDGLMRKNDGIYAGDLDAAILGLSQPDAHFFRTLRDHPDFQCAALTMQLTLHFRGEKLGGLNRKLGEWYVSKLFVARHDGVRALESRGFRRKQTGKTHVYWARSGAGSMTAFREAISEMAGVEV
jgi:hypothetical protein